MKVFPAEALEFRAQGGHLLDDGRRIGERPLGLMDLCMECVILPLNRLDPILEQRDRLRDGPQVLFDVPKSG